MAAITTGTHIMARAKRQLNEPTGTDEGFWDDEDYLNCIEEGQEDFVLKTKCLMTYAEFDTDGTNKAFSLDETALANFMDINVVHFYWATNNYDVLTSLNRDKLSAKESFLNNQTGNPTFFCYEDRVIEFDTIPADEDTCRVYYFHMPAAFTGASVALKLANTPSIPNRFHPALVYYVCWKFAESDDSAIDKMLYYQQKYAELVAQAAIIEEPAASSYPTINVIEDMPYV